MVDIQSTPAQVNLPITSVGVKGFKFPIQILTQTFEVQHTVAVVDMGVNLPVFLRGTHMSRFIEVLQGWHEPLSCNSLEKLMLQIRQKLEAQFISITFSFPYFVNKKAPSTGCSGLLAYDCKLRGKMDSTIEFFLDLIVPVMTVCPCSKAISYEGAHSQRTQIDMKLKLNELGAIEDLITVAESSASSPLYSLLKRADEKYVTEDAFAHPTFVEDVVRNVSSKLLQIPYISGFHVEVESFESIHAHNAYAYIEHQYWNTI